jgi:hypothetical protein
MDHYGRAGWHLIVVVPPLLGRDPEPLRVSVSPLSLSVREVEEMRTGRGVMVFYETIRAPNQLCRRWPRPGDQWHQDEVSIKMGVR